MTLPVKLHVPAKRYLCAVDAAYFSGLSAASVTSLKVQGGPFSEEEAAHFIAQPHAADAVRLRRENRRASGRRKVRSQLPTPAARVRAEAHEVAAPR